MRPISFRLILACLAAGMGAAHAAGNVDVTFVQPQRFSDAGEAGSERDRNLNTISQHLQRLGERYLAPGQTLSVEVMNLDLAGERRLVGIRLIRVLKGRADWPRVDLRYSLKANDQVLRSGEESVADMNYLQHVPTYTSSESLPYETRMLESWFKSRFEQTGIAAK